MTESKRGEEFERLHAPTLPPVMSHTQTVGVLVLDYSLCLLLWLSFYENHVLNIMTVNFSTDLTELTVWICF